MGEIRGRARRRMRRRRALAGTAAALVLVAVGVGLGAAVTADDPGQDVHADGGGPPVAPTVAPTGPTGDGSGDRSLTLEPATGQAVGSRVRIVSVGEPPPGEAVVAQCASEALAVEPADLLAWCVAPEPAPSASEAQTVVVHGSLRTPDGVIACEDGPGRCVIVMAFGDPPGTELRSAPLVLGDAPAAPGGPDVEVDGDEGTVGDGDTLLVTLRGVATGEPISVQQCRTDLHPSTEDRTDGPCDEARARYVEVQEGPETQLTFTAFHDVYVGLPTEGGVTSGWAACEPCELVVRTARGMERFPLLMEPTDTPIRPTVTVEPAGRHAPGATVAVRVTGLVPDSTAYVGWCPVVPAQGGGASACTGPGDELAGYPVASDGTVAIPEFVLPGPGDVVGWDCVAVPGTCGVGLDTGGISAVAVAPLDLSG